MENIGTTLIYYFGEFPPLLAISLAVYLSFEYWKFPDLTVESSFTAGMVFVYLFFVKPDIGVVFFIGFLLLFLYPFMTWLLASFKVQPLLAGLIVVLAAFTFNFLFNGSEISQGGFMRDHSEKIPSFFRNLSLLRLNTTEKFFILNLILSIALLIAVFYFLKTERALKLHLARRITDNLVPKAVGINLSLSLFTCMVIYNAIAFFGGLQYVLQNDNSAVTFLGAVTPGLTCMFVVKGLRELFSSTSQQEAKGFIFWIQKQTDNPAFFLIIIFLVSFLLTILRFWVNKYSGNQIGLINAITALATIILWGLIQLIAKATNRQV